MRKFRLNCDFRKSLRVEEGFDLAVDVGVDGLVLVHDVASQDECAGGEGPSVKLMESKNTGKLLQQILLEV